MNKKDRLKNSVILICTLVLMSCGQKNTETETTTNEANNDPVKASVFETIFEQKGCSRKACNDYQIVIAADQSYSFDSEKVKSTGQLTGKQKTELKVLLDSLNLKGMSTKLKPGSAECLKHRTEAPNYNLNLTKGDFTQSLGFYGGCEPLPQTYVAVMQWFNKLALAQSQPAF